MWIIAVFSGNAAHPIALYDVAIAPLDRSLARILVRRSLGRAIRARILSGASMKPASLGAQY